jgi:hypothetical protein
MTSPVKRYSALNGIVFLAALIAARGADASTLVCATDEL